MIEAGTAALLEPYLDEPGSCGIPNWPPEELAEAVAAFDADGFQVHLHAIGDAGVRAALDAIEHAVAVNGTRDRRPVIAHTQLVHPADLPRFARLGGGRQLRAAVGPARPADGRPDHPAPGPERAAWQYPIGTLARAGARLSFGSDWPVSSVVPMEGLAVAVTRQTGEGHPPGGWLPAERLPFQAALAAYTRARARGRRADQRPVTGTWLAGGAGLRLGGELGRIASGFTPPSLHPTPGCAGRDRMSRDT